MAGPSSHRYRAFGLWIASEIPLPQLPPAADGGEPDLVIRLGPVEPAGADSPGKRVEWGPGWRRGRIYDLYRYSARDGCEITVDLLPGAAASNVADSLISRVITSALYQRGALPLHAAAVEGPTGGVLAFCGQSGAGKSTLAAALATRGWRIIADDMLVAEGDRVWPGATGLKLSVGSLAHIGLTPDGLSLANEVEGKFLLPGDLTPAREPLPLRGLVRIGEGPVGLKRLSRIQATAEWTNCVRMPELMEMAPERARPWERWLALTAATPMASASHGGRMENISALLDAVERFAYERP